MPNRAFLVVFAPLFLTACALWQKPAPVAPSLTSEDVRLLLQEQSDKDKASELPAKECQIPDFAQEFSAHNQELNELSAQVKQLLIASGHKSVQCPEPDKASAQDGKLVIGSIEWVYLNPPGHNYLARIDSGATTSSISVQNLVRFERNGKKWVRFELKPDNEDEAIEVEAPVERNVRIRQASASESDRRPAILLNVQLGSLQVETEFTLTDRSQMTYPMLLGRSFLQDLVLIDVSQELTQPKIEPERNAPTPAKIKLVPAKKSPPASKPATAPKAKVEPVEAKTSAPSEH